MHYLLMCCFEEKRWEALPAERREEIMRSYGALIEHWIASGRYIAGGKLEPCKAAATVRNQGGRPVMSDGPFAETKEQLGGYHVLDCSSFDEAATLAARIPTLAAGGAVEVRPLQQLLR